MQIPDTSPPHWLYPYSLLLRGREFGWEGGVVRKPEQNTAMRAGGEVVERGGGGKSKLE